MNFSVFLALSCSYSFPIPGSCTFGRLWGGRARTEDEKDDRWREVDSRREERRRREDIWKREDGRRKEVGRRRQDGRWREDGRGGKEGGGGGRLMVRPARWKGGEEEAGRTVEEEAGGLRFNRRSMDVYYRSISTSVERKCIREGDSGSDDQKIFNISATNDADFGKL